MTRSATPRKSSRSKSTNPIRKKRFQLPNPSATSVFVGVAIAAAAVGGGALIYKHMHEPLRDPNKLPPADPDVALAQFLKPGATLGDAAEVIADVMQPVYLARSGAGNSGGYPEVSELAVLANVTVQPLDEAIFGGTPTALVDNTWYGWLNDQAMTGMGSPKAIKLLVTNVTGEFSNYAYQYALARVAKDAAAFTKSMRDQTIASILKTIAPQLDWSQGISPYVYGDAAYVAWTAVELIGEVASQSLNNKHLA